MTFAMLFGMLAVCIYMMHVYTRILRYQLRIPVSKEEFCI